MPPLHIHLCWPHFSISDWLAPRWAFNRVNGSSFQNVRRDRCCSRYLPSLANLSGVPALITVWHFFTIRISSQRINFGKNRLESGFPGTSCLRLILPGKILQELISRLMKRLRPTSLISRLAPNCNQPPAYRDWHPTVINPLLIETDTKL